MPTEITIMEQQGETTSTPRQRALALVQERQKEIDAQNVRRRQQHLEDKKHNWHNKRGGKFLTGVRRPREETSVEEVGGAPKIQGIGSPTRPGGSGIKKKVAAPQSILRNKSQNRSSAGKEMDRPGTQANRGTAPAEHDRAVP